MDPVTDKIKKHEHLTIKIEFICRRRLAIEGLKNSLKRMDAPKKGVTTNTNNSKQQNIYRRQTYIIKMKNRKGLKK
jgi:hypothetical protein